MSYTKEDLVSLMLSLPGVEQWYGKDKLTQWASGEIESTTYSKYLNWLNAGHKDWVLGDIQRHTGSIYTLDGWKNENVYNAVLAYLRTSLVFHQQELAKLNEDSSNPDNNPIATQVIKDNIVSTQASIAYYVKLAGQ